MLGQDLFDIKGKSLKVVEKEFTAFKNDLITLSTFHNDYTVDEALGVIKFITPYIINCAAFREVDKKFKISCLGQLEEVRKELQRVSDEQLLGMIQLGNTKWLEDRLND